jgi:predicted transcriptional regulator
MKSVLISIQPKWVEKICNGKKTIEVRKTRPKLKTPFKCYIYCTIGNGAKGDYLVPSGIQCGKVIGEFVCETIVKAIKGEYGLYLKYGKTQINVYDLLDYATSKNDELIPLYGWHISDLKIYDKPKELSEFWTIKCTNKRNGCMGCEVKPNCIKTITRPPQSWQFIEGE